MRGRCLPGGAGPIERREPQAEEPKVSERGDLSGFRGFSGFGVLGGLGVLGGFGGFRGFRVYSIIGFRV